MDSLNQFFVHPIKNHYFDFDGRSTVQQYWMFTLWYLIFSIVLGLVQLSEVATGLGLVTFIPSLAIAARRLHDIGKSGWWQLLWLIPIIGWIILIVFLVTKGETGTNSYGEDPRSPSTSASVATPIPVPVPVPSPIPTPVPVAPTESAPREEVPVDSNPR